jgi:hypothetical protein
MLKPPFNQYTTEGARKLDLIHQARFTFVMNRLTPKGRYDYLVSKGWKRIDKKIYENGLIVVYWWPPDYMKKNLHARKQTQAIRDQIWSDMIEDKLMES